MQKLLLASTASIIRFNSTLHNLTSTYEQILYGLSYLISSLFPTEFFILLSFFPFLSALDEIFYLSQGHSWEPNLETWSIIPASKADLCFSPYFSPYYEGTLWRDTMKGYYDNATWFHVLLNIDNLPCR